MPDAASSRDLDIDVDRGMPRAWHSFPQRQVGNVSAATAVHVVYHHPAESRNSIPRSPISQKFDHHFNPNVPSNSYGDIAGAYVDAHMPGYIWNFNSSGLRLVGGRLDKLPDGRTVTFTFYKGEGNSLAVHSI